MSNTAPSRADPVVVFPLGRWCPPQETSQPHPPHAWGWAAVRPTKPEHDDVIKWKHFPLNWPFVWGIHRSPVNSPHKTPVTQSFDVFLDMRLNKRSSTQSWGWWLETPSCPVWRHCNDVIQYLTSNQFFDNFKMQKICKMVKIYWVTPTVGNGKAVIDYFVVIRLSSQPQLQPVTTLWSQMIPFCFSSCYVCMCV